MRDHEFKQEQDVNKIILIETTNRDGDYIFITRIAHVSKDGKSILLTNGQLTTPNYLIKYGTWLEPISNRLNETYYKKIENE